MSAGILTGIVLNLCMNLGWTGILATLSLPIHVHGLSLHVFRSALTCLSNVLQFSVDFADSLMGAYQNLANSILYVYPVLCLSIIGQKDYF